jgi:DNA-binding NarL/FixJ family response regulator
MFRDEDLAYAKLLAKRPSQMTRLTEREREVLALMAEGRSNSAIPAGPDARTSAVG